MLALMQPPEMPCRKPGRVRGQVPCGAILTASRVSARSGTAASLSERVRSEFHLNGSEADVTVVTYLPDVSDRALQELLFTDDWDRVGRLLVDGGFERVGLDRFFRIYCDVAMRQELCGLKVLDIGCNNGLVARAFTAVGACALGIDNLAVDGQGKYAPLDTYANDGRSRCALVQSDLLEFLRATTCSWDVVLLLSVAHHWSTGYAMGGAPIYSEPEIEEVFARLASRCFDALYFECPNEEPGFPQGSGLAVLDKHLAAPHERHDLGYTIGPQGYPRRLIRLTF